ncbi:helix-turn-helix domain-containing protein [Paenibacillus andongensis]|uniref:helix-turn-helix domain-containing protein n=1 Tax=Paenibacillus andongensis TaxID=2975482 RepID=UPI0021BB59B8|nr:AraC family transcriptional regulator [Paenibacillus andongensis]
MSIFTIKRSMFRNILASFIILILIFSTFNLLIFWLLKSHLRSEMIEQNRLTLQKVAERYQFQMDKVRDALFKQFTDKDVISLNNQVGLKKDSDTLNTRPIVLDIQSVVSDSELYLDNMILLFRSTNLTINKFGSGTTKDLFTDLYTSTLYPLSYWQTQFQRKDNYVLHPAASFGSLPADSPARTLIPYSIKPSLADDMLIAMIDADRLRDAILKEHPALHLTILGPNDDLIYQTNDDSYELPKQLLSAQLAGDEKKQYLVDNGIYYIAYENGDGLRYIMKVTSQDFAAKLVRLDNLMMILLTISIFIALAVAIFFSKRIHKPVRQLLIEKGEIQQALQDQQSLLTNYRYINKLKNINHESVEWPHIQGTEETFTIVLYELRFRSTAFVDIPMSREHISQSIGEHLKQLTDERFPYSHTFQMEHHQFLSVFLGNERERIAAMLEELKQVLDRDRRYCLVTAAVSSVFEHSVQFGHAYRQVKEMAMQARLLEETQIVSEYRSDRSNYVLTLTQEQELTTALKAGKELESLDLFIPWLEELDHKEASVDMFKHLALAVTDKAKKVLEHYKIQSDITWQLKPIMLQLEECCTLEEYKITFQAYFRAVTQIIRDKKEVNDPIIDHVLSVIQDHYAEDLSLDTLADQLNLSTSYLSTYIKEKTGANFMEHLHDRRVRNAQELLHHTDLNIQEIGIQVGYRNISSFNRMFKNRTGSSPGEYRRMNLTNRTS